MTPSFIPSSLSEQSSLEEQDFLAIDVLSESSDTRLDTFLAKQYPRFSRTYFQWLIEQGAVSVNGERVKKRTKLVAGDTIEVHFLLTEALSLEPEDIPLDILYEDDHFLAINKPSGMVVHPAAGNWTKTFVNALIFYCKSLPRHDAIRPGIVHRLDKETSGVLLGAKTVEMHQALTELFSSRKIKKSYTAICLGKPIGGSINAPIARHPTQRKLMAVVPETGKHARTDFTVLASSEALSLLDVDLITGRTHQIRVHLKHIGYPLLGDTLYGQKSANERFGANRQMLHCSTLRFQHPLTGQNLVIEAPLPQDFKHYTTRYFHEYSRSNKCSSS